MTAAIEAAAGELNAAVAQLRRAAEALPAARERHSALLASIEAARAALRSVAIEDAIEGGANGSERTRLRKLREDAESEELRVEALGAFVSGAGVAAVEAASEALRVALETCGARAREEWRGRLEAALRPVAEVLRDGAAIGSAYGVRLAELERFQGAWASTLGDLAKGGGLSLRADADAAPFDAEAAEARELIREARRYVRKLAEAVQADEYGRRHGTAAA